MNVYTVSQINTYIRNMFRQDYLLQSILVRGEVSNCKYHSSGHIYFTLKDSGAAVNCVMFAGNRKGLTFHMSEGDCVIVQASADVYEKAGSYQLYVRQIIRDGNGLLAEKYERLKHKLEEEGLFDERHKKKIPSYIHTLGIVTAPTGAAVQDIIHISLRRDPYLKIILFPAVVQGDEAADSIVTGIRMLDMIGVDVIIAGRGGGSLEDLWAFNEERVARAVYECETPIISAVGHETDTVLTDYTADLRAPTPSAGAELAVFEVKQLEKDLSSFRNNLYGSVQVQVERARRRTESFEGQIRHFSPENRIREQRMYAAGMAESLGAAMERKLRDVKTERSDLSEARLTELMLAKVRDRRQQMQILAAQIEGMSPLRKLSGPYAYVEDNCGKALISVSSVSVGDQLRLRFASGEVKARVEEVSMTEERK